MYVYTYARVFKPTGWQRPIGCLIFIGHFPQKSPIVSGSLAKNDLQLKASYGSSPPCTCLRIHIDPGWTRPIGCLVLIGHFLQKSPIINGSFAKMTCKLRHPVGLCHREWLYVYAWVSMSWVHGYEDACIRDSICIRVYWYRYQYMFTNILILYMCTHVFIFVSLYTYVSLNVYAHMYY